MASPLEICIYLNILLFVSLHQHLVYNHWVMFITCGIFTPYCLSLMPQLKVFTIATQLTKNLPVSSNSQAAPVPYL